LHPGGGGATVKGKDACSPQAQAREVPYSMVMAELPIGLASLQRELAAGRRLPPVETWNPAHCGEIEIRIARDGTWFHQGAPIVRRELVRLFSTILRREAAGYYLVTPAEKMRIQVEHAPFVAVLLDVQGSGQEQHLQFTTNVGDQVMAGADHRLRLEVGESGAPSPYVHIRSGMEARISRSVFYQLAEIAIAGADEFAGRLGVWSSGVFFPLEAAA
jgi:hypothetical protein